MPQNIAGRISYTAIARVSGEAVRVSGETVRISGDVVKISGEVVRAEVSGDVVKISGEVVKVSGETVSLPSTQVVKISGETVSIEIPTEIKTGAIRVVTGASGGAVLHSGAVLSVNVKSLSGDIWIGGAMNRPYSGFGFLLAAGEVKSIDVDDFNRIYLCASTSGDWVTFMGVK